MQEELANCIGGCGTGILWKSFSRASALQIFERSYLISSRIEGWDRFHLDTNEDGSVWKPESLDVEGMK